MYVIKSTKGKKMEKIRTWKDFDRADKVAIIVGICVWFLLEAGVFMETRRYAQLKQNVFNKEVVNKR